MAGLRLRAMDGEDLCVIAAVLQDARAPINEMAFDPTARQFMAGFRRLRRERPAEVARPCFSVLSLHNVDAVSWRGLEPERPSEDHVVLTLLAEAEDRVLLVFQGGEALRFDVERIDVRLEDFEPQALEAAETSA